MLDPQLVARLRVALISAAGGYLRNPVRAEFVTCAVCTTPVSGYAYCYPCNAGRAYGRLAADVVAPLVYAVAGRQSGYVMRTYKAQPPIDEHYGVVAMLVFLALSLHQECPGALAGRPVTHWATVPSLPAKPGEHPLHRIVSGVMPSNEVPLVAAADVANPRSTSSEHFHAALPIPAGSHVLLVDDTWTRGGHAQSAVLALRRAGATRVSVLVVARWIKENYGENAQFLRSISEIDYEPNICPWTGGTCP
jgi:hypothetical protein